MSNISDSKLQRIYKQLIKESSPEVRRLLNSQFHCGEKVSILSTYRSVFVLSNRTDAMFAGHATCKNSWACPVCSVKNMARYAADIACAIDAIKAWYNQVPLMITFSIPHTSGMSCEEVIEILYNTWKDFIVHGNKNQKAKWYSKKVPFSRDDQKVMKVGKTYQKDIFASFCEKFNCKHRVRVCEVTHGNAGWHPHFHCLFWVDKNKLQQTAEWEEKFTERWLQLAQKHTIKIWDKKFPAKKKDNRIRAKIMYERIDKQGSIAAFFSKTEDGKIIEQKSSQYICGWGADKEVTGNVRKKATHEGHMTPYQILVALQETGESKFADLYMEYAVAVMKKKHMRINFSVHSGIRDIIQKWKLSNEYIITYKKKSTDQENKWKVVTWFKEEQWSQICLWEYCNPTLNIKSKILELAIEYDGKKRIEEFLLEFDIDISSNGEHKETLLIEKLYNKSA